MRALLLVLAFCWAPALAAQRNAADDPRFVPAAPVLELRAAVPVAEDPEFQLGLGLSLRAGWYVRTSLALLGGALQRDSATIGVARLEAAARFHIDPFFEAPGCRGGGDAPVCKGIYGGVGLTQRFLGGGIGAQDPALLFILGVEGKRSRRGVWALELGVGAGLRLGAMWRQNRHDGYR